MRQPDSFMIRALFCKLFGSVGNARWRKLTPAVAGINSS